MLVHSYLSCKLRPFQVISVFLVNFTSKNLPGNHEKTNEATNKKNPQKHLFIAEKHWLLKAISQMEQDQCSHCFNCPFHQRTGDRHDFCWFRCSSRWKMAWKKDSILFVFSENLAKNLPAFLWETKDITWNGLILVFVFAFSTFMIFFWHKTWNLF